MFGVSLSAPSTNNIALNIVIIRFKTLVLHVAGYSSRGIIANVTQGRVR